MKERLRPEDMRFVLRLVVIAFAFTAFMVAWCVVFPETFNEQGAHDAK